MDIEQLNYKCNKYRNHYRTLERMLNLKLDGKCIAKYILDKKYECVAIYGLGIIGKSLVKILIEEEIRVIYGIDQDEYKARFFKFPVYTLKEKMKSVDIVIVTVEDEYSCIKSELEKKMNAEIISISYLLSISEKESFCSTYK